MDKRTETYFDANLRDIAKDPQGLKQYAVELEQSIKLTSEPQLRVRLLGEHGVHLRILGELDKAEQNLREALQIIQDHNLGVKLEVQQKIRLAHVLQWKKDFGASDALFDEVIKMCQTIAEASVYLDFALQHAGKNSFDQKKWNKALGLFEEALTLRQKKKAPPDQIDSTLFAIEMVKGRIRGSLS